MSEGTKFDKDKAPLIYNYWDGLGSCGLLNYLSGDYTSLSIGVLHELKIIKSQVDKDEHCESTVANIISSIMDMMNVPAVSIIETVSRVCKMGADKYGHHNYKNGIHYDRLLSAACRHTLAGLENLDEESGLPHWAHMLSNLLMLIELIELGKHKQ